MNIQFYTWRAGGESPARSAAPASSPASAEPDPVMRGNYDRASFQSREDALWDDKTFARSLAKNVIGELAGSEGPRPERIAQLRREIAEGSYHPDAMAIADAMADL